MGESPLHRACEKGFLEIVKYLHERGADMDTRVTDHQLMFGDTPLQKAVAGGHLAVVQYLVDEVGVVVDVPDNEGNTPLHKAAYTGKLEIVGYLIERGSDTTKVNNLGYNPLRLGVKGGQVEVERRLVKIGIDQARHYREVRKLREQEFIDRYVARLEQQALSGARHGAVDEGEGGSLQQWRDAAGGEVRLKDKNVRHSMDGRITQSSTPAHSNSMEAFASAPDSAALWGGAVGAQVTVDGRTISKRKTKKKERHSLDHNALSFHTMSSQSALVVSNDAKARGEMFNGMDFDK